MIDADKLIRRAKEYEQKESECPCPILFRISAERGITLKQLRDEIRLLISMSDDEAESYDVETRVPFI